MTTTGGERSEEPAAGEDQPGESDGAPERGAGPAQRRRALTWLALMAAGPPAILSLLIFASGERGNFLVAVLGLLLAFVFGMAPLLARYRVSAVWRSLTPMLRVRFALGVLTLSATLTGLVPHRRRAGTGHGHPCPRRR